MTPRPDCAIRFQRQRVGITRGNGHDIRQARYLHGNIAVYVISVPELTVGVPAPALDAAAGGDGAGVVDAGGDGRDVLAQADDIHGQRTIRRRAVTELAVAVAAPALHAAAPRDRAAVGVIRQLDLQTETFDVVLAGSIFEGGALYLEPLRQVILQSAPGARLVRLDAPPVVGGVLLGMEKSGFNGYPLRENLIVNARAWLGRLEE